MKKYLVSLLFLSFPLWALEGEVTVLEAPLFGVPDETSKVVQYTRLGDTLYIHPQESAKEKFNQEVAPIEINKVTTKKYDDYYEDPLFTKPSDTYLAKEENLRFYRTLDKRGRTAYILKEHIHVYYQDEREFTQTDITPDPTDYRIQEPLPPNYPFREDTGYKGYLGLGMGRPNDNFYPAGNLRDSTTNSSFQFWANWSKQVDFDKDRRLYWGWMGVYETYDNTYLGSGSIKSKEETMRLALGPQLNYDLWRRPKTIFNIGGSLLLNLLYNKDISNEDTLTFEVKEDSYKSYFITPTLTFSLQRIDVGPHMDFMIGSNIMMDLPHTMRSSSGDSYDQGFSLNFGLFIAGQASY